MLARLQEARKNESGFSLVELLIVIVVLGILGGIVVFGVGTFKSDSTTAACKADVATINTAAAAYQAKTGTTVTSVATLVSAAYLQSTPATTVTWANGIASATC